MRKGRLNYLQERIYTFVVCVNSRMHLCTSFFAIFFIDMNVQESMTVFGWRVQLGWDGFDPIGPVFGLRFMRVGFSPKEVYAA